MNNECLQSVTVRSICFNKQISARGQLFEDSNAVYAVDIGRSLCLDRIDTLYIRISIHGVLCKKCFLCILANACISINCICIKTFCCLINLEGNTIQTNRTVLIVCLLDDLQVALNAVYLICFRSFTSFDLKVNRLRVNNKLNVVTIRGIRCNSFNQPVAARLHKFGRGITACQNSNQRIIRVNRDPFSTAQFQEFVLSTAKGDPLITVTGLCSLHKVELTVVCGILNCIVASKDLVDVTANYSEMDVMVSVNKVAWVVSNLLSCRCVIGRIRLLDQDVIAGSQTLYRSLTVRTCCQCRDFRCALNQHAFHNGRCCIQVKGNILTNNRGVILPQDLLFDNDTTDFRIVNITGIGECPVGPVLCEHNRMNCCIRCITSRRREFLQIIGTIQ